MMNLKVAVPKCGRSVNGLVIPESKLPSAPISLHGTWLQSSSVRKSLRPDVMVRIIRAMGASADAIFYGPQQEVENESKHLAQIILQCTPKERMLIAAIVDTILDVRQRECGLGETEEL